MQVENGWKRFHEVNRVVFDPQQVTVEEMEDWLQEAGTLIRTEERSTSPVRGIESKDLNP